MENWGLLMFREDKLLFHPNVNTLTDKKIVRHSHSLSLWFTSYIPGTRNDRSRNVSPMVWRSRHNDLVCSLPPPFPMGQFRWNDLWLNEGLAVFYAIEGPQMVTDGTMNSVSYQE